MSADRHAADEKEGGDPGHRPERLLYSQAEAAQMLGCSVKTLLKEIRSGDLSFVPVGKLRKFAMKDLQDFIARRKSGGPPPPRSVRPRSVAGAVLSWEDSLRELERRRAARESRKKP